MPQVIAAPLAAAAFNAGLPLAAVNAIAGVGVTGAILHAGVSVALTVGASYAIAKLTAPKVPKPSDGQLEFKQPIPARFFPYGLVKFSGPVLLLEIGGDGNHTLNKITCFGTRELAEFVEFYIDGNDVADADLATNPVADNWWNTNSLVNLHLGTDAQVADATALVRFALGWTADHRLRGIPYAYAALDSDDAADFNGSFPNGEPQFSCVAGVKVYDPTKDTTVGGSGSHRQNDRATWEFSDEQRLHVLDWLLWPEGYDKPFARIDLASWMPQIEMGRELVPLKAGGTEKRYRCATIVRYDEPRGRVLKRLMEAGDQQLYTTSTGLIGTRGGVWADPTVSLEVERFPEMSFTHGVPMMDRINEFQLSCMLPEREYAEFDLEPWINAADPEHIAGIIRRVPLELTQVPSNSQAQRLAKIYMMKRNPRWAGQVRTSFAGLDAIWESVVDLSFEELDQPADNFDGPFFVNGKIALLSDKTGITFPVSSADETAYQWDASEEQDIPGVVATIDLLVQDEDGTNVEDEDGGAVHDEG